MLWSATRISSWAYTIFTVHFTCWRYYQKSWSRLSLLYADDSQLYLAFESTVEGKLGALAQIEMCAKEIDIWMVKNRLKLNGNKTELLIIKSRSDLSPVIENIEVSNSTIQPSTSPYNIGVTFDEYMSMNKHITNICKSCFFHIRKIARIKDYLFSYFVFLFRINNVFYNYVNYINYVNYT